MAKEEKVNKGLLSKEGHMLNIGLGRYYSGHYVTNLRLRKPLGTQNNSLDRTL